MKDKITIYETDISLVNGIIAIGLFAIGWFSHQEYFVWAGLGIMLAGFKIKKTIKANR